MTVAALFRLFAVLGKTELAECAERRTPGLGLDIDQRMSLRDPSSAGYDEALTIEGFAAFVSPIKCLKGEPQLCQVLILQLVATGYRPP